MITIVDKMTALANIIEKAREYRETKSLTTAVEVCDMLIEFSEMAEGGKDSEKEDRRCNRRRARY